MNSKEIKDMTLEEALELVLEKEDVNNVIDAIINVSIPELVGIVEMNAFTYYDKGEVLPEDHPHVILTCHHVGMNILLKKVKVLETENESLKKELGKDWVMNRDILKLIMALSIFINILGICYFVIAESNYYLIMICAVLINLTNILISLLVLSGLKEE